MLISLACNNHLSPAYMSLLTKIRNWFTFNYILINSLVAIGPKTFNITDKKPIHTLWKTTPDITCICIFSKPMLEHGHRWCIIPTLYENQMLTHIRWRLPVDTYTCSDHDLCLCGRVTLSEHQIVTSCTAFFLRKFLNFAYVLHQKLRTWLRKLHDFHLAA